jgi:transcription elongation GreA/GreB family factor
VEQTVRPGSRVVVSTGHGELTLTMHHPEAPDPFTVALDSPIGRALLGARLGDTVEVVSVRKVTILRILP